MKDGRKCDDQKAYPFYHRFWQGRIKPVAAPLQ
jgi:hypothetical protein